MPFPQDNPEDMTTIDSCEYIWEAGVGFAHAPSSHPQYDQHRSEILKLILTCFSETMYLPPVGKQWDSWRNIRLTTEKITVTKEICLTFFLGNP